MNKTIDLNEQQQDILRETINEILEEDQLSQTYTEVFRSILTKLDNEE